MGADSWAGARRTATRPCCLIIDSQSLRPVHGALALVGGQTPVASRGEIAGGIVDDGGASGSARIAPQTIAEAFREILLPGDKDQALHAELAPLTHSLTHSLTHCSRLACSLLDFPAILIAAMPGAVSWCESFVPTHSTGDPETPGGETLRVHVGVILWSLA